MDLTFNSLEKGNLFDEHSFASGYCRLIGLFCLLSFSEVEIHAQFTLNQGRIEEITMKEDIITNNFIGDDGFGDMLFEGELEPELARAGSVLDEPLYQSNDISKISTIDDGEQRAITDSTLERSKLGTWTCFVLQPFSSPLKIYWQPASLPLISNDLSLSLH